SNHLLFSFFFQAEDGIRDRNVTGVQTCALPISAAKRSITFGANEYDDVSVSGTSVDFILIREHAEQLFKLGVQEGTIYHNFSRTTGNVYMEPGDQLFFDGITILINKESLEIFTFEGV